jgi:metal-responsive CopG/Arc/MetJ family transcriptional regulator
MHMQRFYIYLTDEQRKKIDQQAQITKKPRSEIVRDALDKGLTEKHTQSVSAQALLGLVKEAEKIPTKGNIPEDFIKNMDYYTWGGEKDE